MKSNTIIKAKPNRSKGLIDFYAECNSTSYYIFSRKYRSVLYNHFKKGVLISNLFDYGKINGNQTLISTIEYMRSCLKSMEKEYQIQFLGDKRQDKLRNYSKFRKSYYGVYDYYDETA